MWDPLVLQAILDVLDSQEIQVPRGQLVPQAVVIQVALVLQVPQAARGKQEALAPPA